MAATILDAVKVATYTNIGGDILNSEGDIISTYTIATKNWLLGTESIDGVIDLAIGDRVLVKSQTNRSENGIYVFAAATVAGNTYIRLVRSTDFAVLATIAPNTAIFVKQGNKFGDTGWTVSNDSNSVVGSSEITFKRFSINENIIGVDLPSSIVLRSEKGFPLTIDELDGNFKYLAVSLTEKFNTADFTGVNITDQINAMTAQASNLNAWKLRGLTPTTDHTVDTQTVVIRAENGDVTSTTFHGDLKTGVADNATNAVNSQYAVDVTGIVKVEHGGTNAVTKQDARDSLNVVGRAGDRMSGTLVLAAASDNGINILSPLRIELGEPVNLSNGDVWASELKNSAGDVIDYQLRYRYNNISKTVAPLESPNFTGTTTVPDNEKTTNNTRAANTKFVQLHVTDINTALALKAPLASPALTGTPTAPTAAVTVESTQVATTKYVRDKTYDILTNYDTSATVNTKISALNSALDPRITAAQSKADEANRNSGTPVGSIVHFPASNPPLGWLKCNGELVSKTVYASLFTVIGYSYGGSGDFFKLPDLRGEFLRGWDDGRGVDAGRTFGSSQHGSLHVHNEDNDNFTGGIFDNMFYGEVYKKVGYDAVTANDLHTWLGTGVTQHYPAHGGRYTNWAYALGDASYKWTYMSRPRNVAMLACIKAFGVPDNFDASVFSQAINEVNSRVRKAGDAMTGPLVLSGAPTIDLHASTKKYVDDKVANVSLTPGPQGAQGAQGTQGPQGVAGTSSHMFTYGQTQAVGWSNQVGSWNDNSNYVDIYPPSGKTMSDLVAFIPSIRTIHFAGKVDQNDALRCNYGFYSGYIRVWCQNTEQSYYPTINWLAIWRN